MEFVSSMFLMRGMMCSSAPLSPCGGGCINVRNALFSFTTSVSSRSVWVELLLLSWEGGSV
jgi:hypothetical protein